MTDYGETLRSMPRFAGMVKRYHAWPTLQQQTLADHSYHVLRLFQTLFPEYMCSDTVEYIIWHDLGELSSGDSPHPAKRNFPAYKAAMDEVEKHGLLMFGKVLPALSPNEAFAIKLCDLLEMWEFAKVEILLGNKTAQAIMLNIEHAIDQYDDPDNREFIAKVQEYIMDFDTMDSRVKHPLLKERIDDKRA